MKTNSAQDCPFKWRCFYTNANNLVARIDEFREVVINKGFHIVAVTETWARDEVDDAEIGVEGYTMYRKDRESDMYNKGGGVIIYVKDSLKSVPLTCLTDSEFNDSVWCQVERDDFQLIIGTCYRSTSSTTENNDELLKLFEKAAEYSASSHILIMGDFNYPDIDYDNWNLRLNAAKDSVKFFDMTQDLFLYQHVSDFTRVRYGQEPSRLDYIFTDEENVVDNVNCAAPLGKSDHVCIEFNYLSGMEAKPGCDEKRNYWKGNYGAIRNDIQSVDWVQAFANKDVSGMWDIFRDTITSVCEKHVPLRKPPKRAKSSWITRETLKEIKKREKAWKRYRRFDSVGNYRTYKILRNRVVKLIRRDKLAYHKKLFSQFRSNPKRFYGYFRRMQTVKTTVTGVRSADGNLTNSDQETAETLCNYFSEVFTKENTWEYESVPPVDKELEVVVTEAFVLKALKNLKPDKSPGPDNIHPMVLKEAACEVVKPLTVIFQKSVSHGELPNDWKRANVTPIHKNGAKDEASNYRPVSLTSVVCKLLETVVKDQIVAFLNEEDTVSDKQHGFVKGRSCLTNLLEVFEHWTTCLDEGYGVDVVYLDYRKAFDTVPHQRLLTKLRQMGLGFGLTKWIGSLSNRLMRVLVNGQGSPWIAVVRRRSARFIAWTSSFPIIR